MLSRTDGVVYSALLFHNDDVSPVIPQPRNAVIAYRVLTSTECHSRPVIGENTYLMTSDTVKVLAKRPYLAVKTFSLLASLAAGIIIN